MSNNFWQQKTLGQMSTPEWESLCDGCGKCCLQKLEDDDTRELHYTSVACHLLDSDKVRCKKYEQRNELVSGCLNLKRDLNETSVGWLPSTCAYRLLYEGRELPEWHPLISGNESSVVDANMSVAGRVISEEHVHPEAMQDYIVKWVNIK